MPINERTPARPTIALRRDTYREACIARGLVTTVSQAAALGMNRAQIIRNVDRTAAPGPEFIAAVLTTFHGRQFTDFFEVVGW